MKEKNFFNSACRHCRHYQPEGRRGGSCQQLGVSVDSSWKACILASAPFDDSINNLDTTLTTLDTALITLEEIVQLETALSLSYESYSEQHTKAEKTIVKDDLIPNQSHMQ
ncbi:conserved hypothetical protein [Hyella patelloides LEGE 07179]|uniref:Uncharacterized protein n=1 Tax=Hyella patelloides LEGE 07179 TaxID=945734 RepID=A0A563W2C8_9CYAN|nr:hypothetical protein [Hyella patelloides]VEP17859.1 conserved hypothetical protein [Hyella patelloides LEGE 07179]